MISKGCKDEGKEQESAMKGDKQRKLDRLQLVFMLKQDPETGAYDNM